MAWMLSGYWLPWGSVMGAPLSSLSREKHPLCTHPHNLQHNLQLTGLTLQQLQGLASAHCLTVRLFTCYVSQLFSNNRRPTVEKFSCWECSQFGILDYTPPSWSSSHPDGLRWPAPEASRSVEWLTLWQLTWLQPDLETDCRPEVSHHAAGVLLWSAMLTTLSECWRWAGGRLLYLCVMRPAGPADYHSLAVHTGPTSCSWPDHQPAQPPLWTLPQLVLRHLPDPPHQADLLLTPRHFSVHFLKCVKVNVRSLEWCTGLCTVHRLYCTGSLLVMRESHDWQPPPGPDTSWSPLTEPSHLKPFVAPQCLHLVRKYFF